MYSCFFSKSIAAAVEHSSACGDGHTARRAIAVRASQQCHTIIHPGTWNVKQV